MRKNKTKSYNQNFADFDALKLTLASPEQILDWSHGEVTKSETINYRTYREEPDGIFCQKIFGPSENYACFCGKYKKIRYKGIVCDKCGVEVTKKDVRRERMGHIGLVVPVAHLWFAYTIPSKLAIILDMPQKKLLAVIYYTRYMVVNVDADQRQAMMDKAEEALKADLDVLKEQLDGEIKEIEAQFDAKIAEIKADKDGKKTEFKADQQEHKKQQAIAKVRMQYAEREEEIAAFYGRLTKLISEITVGTIMTEDDYVDLTDRDLLFFEAKMGAEAIEELLKNIDLESEIKNLKSRINKEKSQTNKMNLIRRLQYVEGLYKNNIDPTWMIMKNVPVLPPDLRPIISLAGGKFASSDLNDLYRRVINRNNRLKKLIEIGAPDVILRNEKRMLQEAVDALIDNMHRPGKPMLNSKRLPYRSLTDELKGKKGLFRRNLLGKRVDYSGRAVIIGDTKLKLHQCGLPKQVALEIFKPFVIHALMNKDIAPNIKVAKDFIDNGDERVWDVLEEIIKDKPVLLNRAPTLHKYSIQAFYPVLVEGDSIRIHPLVCQAFNADFDGDQMAVHVLLTDEALEEGRKIMLSTENIISMADGKILALPRQEMLLGFFLLTDLDPREKPKMFGTFDEAIKAYNRGNISANEEIIAKGKGGVHKTSVGRIIFNNVLPEDYPFVNERIGQKESGKLIAKIRTLYPKDVVVKLLDDLKTLGFKYSTELAFSFGIEDCKVNIDLESKIKEVEEKDEQLQENYLQGLLTHQEKISLSTKMWNDFTEELAAQSWESLDKNNPVYEMVTSGANGGVIQARQIMSIKGLVRDSSGRWIPLPIKGNYRDGLSAFEYFVAANGARKGVADTALRTSSSGYLTRKLCDVAHDVIIRLEDCGYEGDGFLIRKADERRPSFADTLTGRVLAQEIKDKDGNVIAEKNVLLSRETADAIDEAGVEEAYVRSPITCQAPQGICQMCYGHNIENGEIIGMGRAVGIIAAQSIGEPGTQMTMRTFHTGAASRTDITQGLPRVEELLEARTPKAEAPVAKIDGKVSIQTAEDGSATIMIEGSKDVIRHYIVSEAKKVSVNHGDKVKMGQTMFIDSSEAEKQSPFDGVVELDHGVLTVKGRVDAQESVSVLPNSTILVNDGDEIKAGTQLLEGSVDPKKLADFAGIEAAQRYVVTNVQKIFNEQGVSVNDIHLETIVRQMARLGMVMEAGDSGYLVGALVNRYTTGARNELLRKSDKKIALVIPKLLGIKTSALKTESFLSSMSFQEQVRGLTEASITGKIDYLRGMKENVMIGRRIPAGEEARIDDPYLLEEVAIS